jgi:hypothetical protein
MKISITGLGWFGEPLAQALIEQHHTVCGTTRDQEKKRRLIANGIKVSILDYPELPSREILDSEVLILNIPPFLEELNWFKQWNIQDNTWIIFISSTSVENKSNSKNALLLKEQEKWIEKQFKRWTILRFGGLLGNGRHPAKYLSGKKNLPGRLWQVHLLELTHAIKYVSQLVQNPEFNIIKKIVSIEGKSREEFYVDYCRKNNLPLPEFDPADDSEKP